MQFLTGLRDLLQQITSRPESPPRPPPADALQPDDLKVIGEPEPIGLIATVAEAEDKAGNKVILKRWSDMPPDAHQHLQRMLMARMTLDGPGFLPIQTYGADGNGRVYCVQEHRPRTLTQYLKENGQLNVEEVQDIITQVARALGEAHEREITHGNPGPNAIYVSTKEGRDPGTIAVDFARYSGMQMARDPALTISELFPTGKAYMSPEMVMGHPPDALSDLYLLGVLAYELFAGRSPYGETAEASEKMKEIIIGRPNPLKQYRPEVPPQWESAVMKLLQKHRKQRFRSVDEFLASIAG
jgi:serine/threonine protein kinase